MFGLIKVVFGLVVLAVIYDRISGPDRIIKIWDR